LVDVAALTAYQTDALLVQATVADASVLVPVEPAASMLASNSAAASGVAPLGACAALAGEDVLQACLPVGPSANADLSAAATLAADVAATLSVMAVLLAGSIQALDELVSQLALAPQVVSVGAVGLYGAGSVVLSTAAEGALQGFAAGYGDVLLPLIGQSHVLVVRYWPPLPGQYVVVPADCRVALVLRDARTLLIASDDREADVPADARSALVPADQRYVLAPV
jgi:hypothetical protein